MVTTTVTSRELSQLEHMQNYIGLSQTNVSMQRDPYLGFLFKPKVHKFGLQNDSKRQSWERLPCTIAGLGFGIPETHYCRPEDCGCTRSQDEELKAMGIFKLQSTFSYFFTQAQEDAADPAKDPNNQGEDEYQEAEIDRPAFEEKANAEKQPAQPEVDRPMVNFFFTLIAYLHLPGFSLKCIFRKTDTELSVSKSCQL